MKNEIPKMKKLRTMLTETRRKKTLAEHDDYTVNEKIIPTL